MKRTSSIDEAIAVLKKGGVVAFPTETSYGLGACIDSLAALESIFRIKKRETTKPLLVLADEASDLAALVSYIPESARPLMERFWPGPLTILFPARDDLAWPLCGNTGKIGVRISSGQTARALVRGVERPITATSANLSGHPPAYTPDEVLAQLSEFPPDLILDGGSIKGTPPSTIVDVTVSPPLVVREGEISREDIPGVRGKAPA